MGNMAIIGLSSAGRRTGRSRPIMIPLLRVRELPSCPRVERMTKAKVVDYSARIPELMEELQTKTLSEAEKDRNLTILDYTGVGYGYNFKSQYPKNLKKAERDTHTPELKRLEKLIASMEK
jgi:hypothetical protein